MKGFIEVHDYSDAKKVLLNVHNIISVYAVGEETCIRTDPNGEVWSVDETYAEVKEKIKEAAE